MKEEDPKLEDVIASLITHSKNPSQLLELYYWSEEEGLTEFIRGVLALPSQTRTALLALFKASSNKPTIRSKTASKGSVTLISSNASQIFDRQKVA